jgi:hypothetical protein
MKNTLHSLTYKGAQYYPSLGNTVHLLEEKVPGYTSYTYWFTNANWNINRGIFWSASCFSINWCNCYDSFCNLVRCCVFKNEIYNRIKYIK